MRRGGRRKRRRRRGRGREEEEEEEAEEEEEEEEEESQKFDTVGKRQCSGWWVESHPQAGRIMR